MPVDKSVFSELLAELAGYYNRELSPLVYKAWFKFVGEKLTTEQFTAAVEQAVCYKSFMPTPEELLKLAVGNSEEIALEEWEKCLDAAIRGNSAIVSYLSPAGQFALRTIGGLRRLAQAEEKDNHWIRKEFMQSWGQMPVEQQQPALPPARDEGIVPPQLTEQVQGLLADLSMRKPQTISLPPADFHQQVTERLQQKPKDAPLPAQPQEEYTTNLDTNYAEEQRRLAERWKLEDSGDASS